MGGTFPIALFAETPDTGTTDIDDAPRTARPREGSFDGSVVNDDLLILFTTNRDLNNLSNNRRSRGHSQSSNSSSKRRRLPRLHPGLRRTYNNKRGRRQRSANRRRTRLFCVLRASRPRIRNRRRRRGPMRANQGQRQRRNVACFPRGTGHRSPHGLGRVVHGGVPLIWRLDRGCDPGPPKTRRRCLAEVITFYQGGYKGRGNPTRDTRPHTTVYQTSTPQDNIFLYFPHTSSIPRGDFSPFLIRPLTSSSRRLLPYQGKNQNRTINNNVRLRPTNNVLRGTLSPRRPTTNNVHRRTKGTYLRLLPKRTRLGRVHQARYVIHIGTRLFTINVLVTTNVRHHGVHVLRINPILSRGVFFHRNTTTLTNHGNAFRIISNTFPLNLNNRLATKRRSTSNTNDFQYRGMLYLQKGHLKRRNVRGNGRVTRYVPPVRQLVPRSVGGLIRVGGTTKFRRRPIGPTRDR